jgi:hypothetical protein
MASGIAREEDRMASGIAREEFTETVGTDFYRFFFHFLPMQNELERLLELLLSPLE